MKQFKTKLMFIIGMIVTLTLKSQWDGGASTGSDLYRLTTGGTGTVAIAPSDVPTILGGGTTHLLIVGYGNGSSGNIGQWHNGTYGAVNSASSYWINLGLLTSGEYGLNLQSRKSTGVIEMHRNTGGNPADMEIIWGSLDEEDYETNLYYRYAANVATTASAPVIASLSHLGTLGIGHDFVANRIMPTNAYEEKSLYVQNKIFAGWDGSSSSLLPGYRDATLIVKGSAQVGDGFWMENPPTDGLLVEGVTGIGNPAPHAAATLDVGGDIVLGNPADGERFIIHTRAAYSGDALVFSADDGSGDFFTSSLNDLGYGRSQDGWSIGVAPSSTYCFAINGQGLSTSATWATSDERLKYDITKVENPLAILKKLNPVSYLFKQDIMVDNIEGKVRLNLPTEKQYGFLAQEVQKVLPELVRNGFGEYLALNYEELIPMLVAGVNTQQKAIEQLQSQLQEAQIKLACLPVCDGNKQDNSTNTPKDGTSGKLEQNVPNPFGSETTIKFTLPASTSTAMMLISNLEGKQIQKINIGNDATQIKITGSSLVAGTYFYTLIANSKVVDTKKMIIIGD